MMFCQTDSHAGIPLDQEACYIRRFFFRGLDFFDETALVAFTGHKQKYT